MTRYMLAVHNCEGEPAMSPEEMQQSWHEIATLEADMKSKGAWVFSGRLHDADTATVVRASTNGALLLTTDGPFVEAREHLGGLYIINAKPVLSGNIEER
jgi:hypothetical protein